MGNAANFALNALLAGPDGRLFLRIDDLDRARYREEYLVDTFAVLDWLGISVTDGPTDAADFHAHWSQEHRLPLYEAALNQLRNHPLVFACPCSRKDLSGGEHRYDCLRAGHALTAPNMAWRLNTRKLPPVVIPDLVRANPFEVDLHEEMPDFVIRKKDGRPSYQPACVVDDAHFGVTIIGRGEDLLASTAAQAVLAEMLGCTPLFERITFVHHPLVTDAAGDKLSKSAGAQGVSALRQELSKEQVFNLARSWLAGITW